VFEIKLLITQENAMYTVKQCSDLAGVSVRTLHYYDEIGLLKPSSVGENGYRYYEDADLFRLQQILFFREMDLGLLQIKDILDRPDFDLVSALQEHRHALEANIERMQGLINTVDNTIMHLVGDVEMSKKKKMFEGFSEEKQKEYEQEAARRWGKDTVQQSVNRWNSYSDTQKKAIQDEGGQVYLDLVAAMPTGHDSDQTQAILVRWHEHIRYFYEPSIEVLGGLGKGYYEDPDFNAFFARIHPDLPEFISKGIAVYVDKLETAWLERELEILEE
jgi:MerR family transcriptional regulator, thiopeptide resistance regulator